MGGNPEFSDSDDIDFSRTVEISAGHEKRAEFYGKYCRTCHVSQTGLYGESKPASPAFNCQICHASADGGGKAVNLSSTLCTAGGAPPSTQMPNALISHRLLAEENLNIDRSVMDYSLLSSLGAPDVKYTLCENGESIYVPPPKNDLWKNAIELSPGTIGGSLVAATLDSGSSSSVGSPGKPEVWYKFTAPHRGTYQFNTCGSNYGDLSSIDTVLSIHSAGPGSVANELAANDDIGNEPPFPVQPDCFYGSPYDSALNIRLSRRQSVLIRVSIFDNTAVGGNFQLQLVAPKKHLLCIPFNDKHGKATMVCF